MKIRQTKDGNMCEGCEEYHSAMHRVYIGCKGKRIRTGLRLSREGMTAFCKAVATLLEFELNGVEVDV